MFTNSNKRPDATNTQPDPWSALAANGAPPAEPREEPARPRLATFEILGQTLVATVTVESLLPDLLIDPRPVEVVGPEGASLGIVDREAVARVLD